MFAVEAIVEEESRLIKDNGTGTKLRPLHVTVVTHDVALFCDVRDGSHQRGFGRFWDMVKPFFEDGAIGKIDVVVAKTGVVAMAQPSQPQNGVVDRELAEEGENQSEQSTFVDDHENEKEARNAHELSMAKCVRVLRSQTMSKAASDERYYSHKTVTTVEIAISMMDATDPARRLSFKSLMRRRLRDIVASISTSILQTNGRNKPNGILLNFPETIDGIQRSVALDIRYKIAPFALDRPVTCNGFFSDLTELSNSNLELVRQVPLASVDASLLYGIPMEVRTGFIDDIQQYQESLVLVRSIFRTLQQRQVGLLLRIADPEEDDEPSAAEDTREEGGSNRGIFHNSRRGQTFLLMANEPPRGIAPTTGVLFRLASADEFLLEAENPRRTTDPSSVPKEVVEQYETYIENAIDLLDSGAVNPLYLDAVANPFPSSCRQKSTSTAIPADKENRWNDDTGVGALQANGLDSDDSDSGCIAFDYD